MAEKPMKLTYHRNGTKRNAYLEPPPKFAELKEIIAGYLFSDGKQKRFDFRTFWIDEDSDEIDIVYQNDYDIFLRHNKDRLHIQIMPVDNNENSTKNSNQFEGLFPTTEVHKTVECDGCKIKPIVGFRYKCIECHNFDLCQRCEAMHSHPDHIMVRLPNYNCPSVIDAWITGRSRRSHKRGSRAHCPFVSTQENEMPSNSAGGGDSERHHHGRRSHKYRGMNSGLLGHFYTMMQDLAEGGINSNVENVNNTADATAEAATNAAKAAAAAAAASSAAAAQAAAEVLQSTKATKTEAAQTQEEPNNGSKPKTTSSEPGATTGNAETPEPETTPNFKSPSFENFLQLLDPQYMQTGIQIMNNFSEMFAKMLDPNDGVGLRCPFNVEENTSERKSSSTSNASSTHSTAESTPINTEKVAADEKAEKVESDTPTSTTDASVVSASTSLQAQISERRRSQSIEDNDWQVIENQSTTPMNENTEAENAKAGSTSLKSPTQSIDFVQLSKDLKAHIEDEQKREESGKPQMQASPFKPATPNTVNASTAPISTPSTSAIRAEATPTQTPIPLPRVPEEKRAVFYYHPDPRINNAVHAMMSMGFSNEGAWLTHLLESVNGNIPEALDLMNAAQRNNK